MKFWRVLTRNKSFKQLAVVALFGFFLFSFALFTLPIHAQEEPGLVTCGLQNVGTEAESAFCTICDLIVLVQNIMNKAMYVFAAPIAAFMLGYGGFLMVWAGVKGGDTGMYGKGKTVMTNSIIGIVIIFSSWLLIDTLMKGLGAYQYAVSANFGPWNKIECSAPPISLPKHMGCNGDKCEMIAGSGSATCTNDRNCKDKIHNGCDAATQKCVDNIPGVGTDDCTVGDDAECVRQIAIGTAGPPCTATPGTICNAKNEDEGVDTFKPNPGANCAYNAVSRYNSAIDDAVSKVPKSGNINLNAMIKATIAQESKGDLHPPPVCDTTVQGKKICTYGLMQISTSVANQYRNRCGVAQQTEETMPNLTADQQICLGAFYLTDLPGIPADQRDVRTLAAHFNGGGTGSSGGKGALDASQHCSACSMNPQQTTATKRWECQWDDSQHSTCNTGYSNLRKKYVPNVLKCYNEFQK